MRFYKYLYLFFILLVTSNVHAATYFVSTTGSNGNSGTSSGAAWATLQFAHNTASAGDTINILAGQYYQRVFITKNNLTWTGAGIGSTTVDGTDSLTGWVSQGSGMYRVAFPGYAPGGLNATASVLSLGKIKDSMMAGSAESCGTGFQVLQSASNFVCEGRTYWDGWEASFGNNGGFVYMRFRGGENPNGMQVRSAPSGANDAGTFTIAGGDGNIIENMTIVGGTYAVYLRSGADNTIIRNNTIRNGVNQIFLSGVTGTQILNNTLRVNWIGATAGYASFVAPEGNWRDPTFGDARVNQYHHDKFENEDGGEHTGGIYNEGANNTVIDGNDIRGGTVSVDLDGGTGTVITNNYFSNCSAECIFWVFAGTLTLAHNKLSNGAHLIRIQYMEDSGKTGWFYRNHFHQDFEGAKHIHWSFIVRAVSTTTVYVYHNTFTGAGYASDCGCGDSGTIASMENIRYINNILTGPEMNISSVGLNGNPGTDKYLGMWSYNHVSNGDSIGGATNYINNTSGGANPIWSNPLTDVLLPPGGHAALNSGIRLDQNWTIGSTRSALPGMTGGYYTDTTPHRGQLQQNEGTIDTTSPTVSITAPTNGATVSGNAVSVTATANDNVAVEGVQFKIDGNNLQAEDMSGPPWAITWDTTGTANGNYTLTATARDAAGNTTTSAGISVTISNGDTTSPTVSITAPSNAATVSGTTVAVTATANDNIAVVGVQFKIDGNNLQAEDMSGPPWAITWDTTLTPNGSHTLTAVARDAAGNSTTSTGISVTVSNTDTTAPIVTMTAPSNGAVVGGTSVVVTANATDLNGIVVVQFKLDGANLGAEDTSAPYSITWNSTLAIEGSHTLTATARDPSNNMGTATSITVTVDNLENTPPVVSITIPTNGAIIQGRSVPLQAVASDNVAVVGVQFKIDGVNIGSEQCCATNDITINTFFIDEGPHVLTATARDAANNITTSTPVNVTVANNPTGVFITANTTITFLGNPTAANVTADPVPLPSGDPSLLSITAAIVPVFPSNTTGTGISATGTPVFLGNPSTVGITIP